MAKAVDKLTVNDCQAEDVAATKHTTETSLTLTSSTASQQLQAGAVTPTEIEDGGTKATSMVATRPTAISVVERVEEFGNERGHASNAL